MEYLGIDLSCAMGSLRNGEFPEKDCLLPLISKLLGYILVAASITVKLPQIMKIVHHKSVRGLSVVAFELEVVGYTISLAYCLHKGLPFSAFGEMAFLLIQALILVACIYYYSQPVPMTTWFRALLYCAVAPTVLAGQINPTLFDALYASMRGKSRETKANMRLYRVCCYHIQLVRRRIVLEMMESLFVQENVIERLFSKMVDVEGNSGLLLDINVNNETETTNSQHKSLVVNGPLESISFDLALDTLAEVCRWNSVHK
ncbi:hypothetical protein F2Q69_00002556 [Brassica cretica]|uniref:Mannose-P-dolichol utilization defect 1 protein homolog n=1 Tax=Brassica cretica TaxID=69181 RepID=A0A8S9P1J0_BRACR|nr:hypothetical protein F2Q69_00002556 [Brassica cretica]